MSNLVILTFESVLYQIALWNFFGSLLLLAITKMSRNLGRNSPPNNPMAKFGTKPTKSNAQLQIKMVKLV